MGHLVMAISGGNPIVNLFLLDKWVIRCCPSGLISASVHTFYVVWLAHLIAKACSLKIEIITDGVLATLPADQLRSAQNEHGANRSGAGGIHNWFVKSTGQTFSQMLKELGTGLLVTEVMGQGVNVVTGDYSRAPQGFWVENGEIQYPVSEITIAGNLKEMFTRIVAVGSDVETRSQIQTGSILLESMKIAGE